MQMMKSGTRPRSHRPTALAVPLAVLFFALPAGFADADFDASFHDRTMRVDIFHTGGPGGEVLALDRTVDDGPWAGSQTQLIDSTDLGVYRVQVRDQATGTTLYSRGFSSIYGEWETTPEARTISRTFHESLRLPWPRRAVTIEVEKRVPGRDFSAMWSTDIDPNSRHVNSSPRAPSAPARPLFVNGAPHEKVDLLVLGDGYTAQEADKFRADAERLVGALFELEPFESRRDDFNVRTLLLPSARSGVNRPRAAAFRRTPLSTEYNIFDLERYVLTYDNRTLRDVASAVPYDFIEILVNESQYGGGGIFNDHATTSVDNAYSDYVFIHEFGHHFAGLADEYYTSEVAYSTESAERPEPWEPNVTALHDPDQLKWQAFVIEGTPIPTPWNKTAYESRSAELQAERQALREQGATEQRLDTLFRLEQEWSTAFLAAQPHAGRVGAYEGAAYHARGLYRPSADCIMFTRDEVGFCDVCRAAIERIIDLHSRP
jgi:hypothetical protein